jgi:glucose/arabinose dehydrogenase
MKHGLLVFNIRRPYRISSMKQCHLFFFSSVALTACSGDTDTPPPPPPMLQATQALESESVPGSLPLPERAPPPPNIAAPMPPPAPGLPPRIPTAESASGSAGTLAAHRADESAPQLEYSVLLRGLRSLRDFVFLPEGTLLFTERTHGLSMRRPNGQIVRLFAPKDLAGESGGMFGLAVDPQFASNRFVYVFMTSAAGARPDHRVVRLTVDAATGTVGERRDIVTGIPGAIGTDADSAAADPHVGGRLRFGPDGYLYVAVGDMRDADAPQSRMRLAGKVLRVDRNGKAAPSNRSATGFDARVYSYGMRNPQGLAFRPGTQMLYALEDGAGSDKITVLQAGGNGGWDPRCPIETTKAPIVAAGYCGIAQPQTKRPLAAMTDLSRFPDAMRPVWTNLNRAQGMAGADFLIGGQWKAWNGALAVAFTEGQRIDVLEMNAGGGVAGYTSILARVKRRWRTLALGPDGALYAGTDGKPGGDEIWRIAPQ